MKRALLFPILAAVLIVGGVLVLLSPFIIRTLAFEPYTIPSAAMEPTLYQGDYIVVAKGSYGYSRHSILGDPPLFRGRRFFRAPKRGDIVVFKLPRDGRTSYIKRLIGLPGDRVQLRQGQVWIDDKPLPQRFERSVAVHDRGEPEQAQWKRETTPEGRSYLIQVHAGDSPSANTAVYVVPPHCYFMLGDNRDNSADSRFDPGLPPNDPRLGGCGWDPRLDEPVGDVEGVGFVPEENLVGEASIVFRRNQSGGARIEDLR
jgi:signal peptidase I